MNLAVIWCFLPNASELIQIFVWGGGKNLQELDEIIRYHLAQFSQPVFGHLYFETWGTFAHQHSITSLKTGIFCSTAVRASTLTV